MADEAILVGGGGKDYAEARALLLRYANRHGLIAGATGTGKTVTLQILAEGLSAAGVPVVVQDVKGDISGLSRPGDPAAKPHEALTKRAAQIGMADFAYRAYPVVFWDLFGETGHPVRSTVSEMGPLLLARMMELSEAQEGVLNIAFRVADEQGLALLDLKDLQAMLVWLGDNAREVGPHLRQHRAGIARRDPARAARAREPGRRRLPRRAGARAQGPDRGRRRHGTGQRADVGAADAGAAALRDVPALAALGAVRAASRGRRPGQAGAGLLLRRGAPALLRRAEAAGRQGRPGGAADPLQGRRRLFLHPEPRRRARRRARPARQPRPARAAGLHPARRQGAAGRRRRPSGPIPTSTPRRRSANAAPARRWSRCSRPRACRRWSAGR